ncbi:MAG: pyrroline-5-carboxylate reductase [Clostridia bacterium]|nr:pyrroline-5-carboxylate reductase [Clostridia bacterium]
MKLAFIGGGNMASAILNGIIKSGFLSASDITVSDYMPEKLESFKSEGVNITSDNMAAVASADAVIFAVKPDVLRKILPDFASFDKLFISIAAGVKIAELKNGLGEDKRIIRVMPNTPAMAGEGMTVLCESDADEKDMEFATSLFNTVGKTAVLNEKYIDAVTAVSGSGPAYIYMVIEAMADGGVLCGLPRDIAYTLAAQTVLGSAKMVLQSGEHPGVLKDRVCSPGGTTIEAVYSLEQSDIRGAFIEAVKKCADKSKLM